MKALNEQCVYLLETKPETAPLPYTAPSQNIAQPEKLKAKLPSETTASKTN